MRVRFVVQRLLESVFLLWGLMTAVFFLARLLPGDATTVFLSPTIPLTVLEQIKTQFGLDRSVWEQYTHWLWSLLNGNLGYSFTRGAPVAEVIRTAFPNTLLLGAAALSIEIVLGIGIASAFFFFARQMPATVLSRVTLVVYSLPPFWVGMLLLLVFSHGMGILPSSHMRSTGAENGNAPVLDVIRHLILPALTAAIPAAAGFARYLHGSVRTVLRQDFLLNGISLGLTRRELFRAMILPNVLSPIITLVGIEIGLLLSGVLVTEYLFSWPGMGRLTVAAISARDYPLVLGCTFVAGVVVTCGNLLSDVVNALHDPRTRTAH